MKQKAAAEQAAPKRRPGRPRVDNPIKAGRRLGIILQETIFEEVELLARAKGKSMNQYIRDILTAEVKKNAALIKKQRALTLDANATV